MINRHAAFAGLLALSFAVSAQVGPSDAVNWSTRVEPVKGAQGERLFRLQFEGRISEGYIIYGPDFDAELGPRPTRLRLDGDAVKARDALLPAGTQRGKDKVFKTDYTYFQGQARLSQVIAAPAGVDKVSGRIVGQTCYEADGTCALFTSRFEVALPQ